ncbi:hypothetical protein MXD62_23045 [Frankia sp. Mgl5]|uniref:hypothetical protein n=1 Tax=Frankia sp. Mgl5 TaxID=2933793 RepID=UPI0020104AA9|nr:hypothetical protein [Frankia sp. Mgl5]MCK9930007.1 hypothetical protein [Frankia sp. Mgl5]
MQQLDLLAALDPAPPAATPWTFAEPSPYGPNAHDPRAALLDHLPVAVALHGGDLAGWDGQEPPRRPSGPELLPRRIRAGMPAGWAATVGMADAMLYTSKVAGRAGLAYNTWSRALGNLACQPGGVALFGQHWCAAEHAGCPNGGPNLGPSWAELAARCRWAIGRPEWQEPLDELATLLADDALGAAA